MRARRTILNLTSHKLTSHSFLTSIKFPQAPHPSSLLHSVQFIHSSNDLHRAISGVNVTSLKAGPDQIYSRALLLPHPKTLTTEFTLLTIPSPISWGGEDLTNVSDGLNVGQGESLRGRRGREKFIGQRSVSKKLGIGGWGNVGFKKKGKSRETWVCSDCGNQVSQWWGACRACNTVGTLKKFSDSDVGGNKSIRLAVSESAVGTWLPLQAANLQPMRLTDVNRGINKINWRIPLYKRWWRVIVNNSLTSNDWNPRYAKRNGYQMNPKDYTINNSCVHPRNWDFGDGWPAMLPRNLSILLSAPSRNT
ncbi:LapB, rubredoxin metal binding domain [Dillenia turbinata]|uniref:LapB, rubredoxin metal binding domain n=1 Tax=Dillenia turbinata TaxID=194707 RepID=A0AAN8UDH6_9MAGN